MSLVWHFRTKRIDGLIRIVRKYSHVSALGWSRDVFRDIELNEVCNELCVEKTLTCITKCDPTDSECISTCLRAEITCVDSKSKAFLKWIFMAKYLNFRMSLWQ